LILAIGQRPSRRARRQRLLHERAGVLEIALLVERAVHRLEALRERLEDDDVVLRLLGPLRCLRALLLLALRLVGLARLAGRGLLGRLARQALGLELRLTLGATLRLRLGLRALLVGATRLGARHVGLESGLVLGLELLL